MFPEVRRWFERLKAWLQKPVAAHAQPSAGLGDVLKAARLAAKMTQAHLAAAAEVSERTIRRAESEGKIGFENLRALCAVLSIPLPSAPPFPPRWRVLVRNSLLVSLFLLFPPAVLGFSSKTKKSIAMTAAFVVALCLAVEIGVRLQLPLSPMTERTREMAVFIAHGFCAALVSAVMAGAAVGAALAARTWKESLPLAALALSVLLIGEIPLGLAVLRIDADAQKVIAVFGSLSERNRLVAERRQAEPDWDADDALRRTLLDMRTAAGWPSPVYLGDLAAFKAHAVLDGACRKDLLEGRTGTQACKESFAEDSVFLPQEPPPSYSILPSSMRFGYKNISP